MGCDVEETRGKPADPQEVVQDKVVTRTTPNIMSENNADIAIVNSVIYNRSLAGHNSNQNSSNSVNKTGQIGQKNDCNHMEVSGVGVNNDDEVGAVGGVPQETTPSRSTPTVSVAKEVQEVILRTLGQLQERIEEVQDIPDILYEVPLACLQERTIVNLCYHLDIESDTMSPNGNIKDYRGMGEWIGLEPLFIRYVSGAISQYKTKEIISKWMTQDVEPKPTIQNLRQCLLAIDRPDVLEDMSIVISRDAVLWKKTQHEANLVQAKRVEDTSWQLTRHDVVSKKKTLYTACLLYADEDELMADLIIHLYEKAYKDARFFIPQFDLKIGKWELDTTARIIDERCDKKVVFLLSEYFYASNICQFAVNYVAAHGTGHGNLIPFHLNRNVTSIPNVLKGIAGIRWFRKPTRKVSWEVLTDCLLGEKVETKKLLEEIKEKIMKMVEKEPEYYLQDPPYAEGTQPPGEPISVIEPESSSFSVPEICEEEQIKQAEELLRKRNAESKKKKWKMLKRIQKVICEKVFKVAVSNKQSSKSSCPIIPMEPLNSLKESSSQGAASWMQPSDQTNANVTSNNANSGLSDARNKEVSSNLKLSTTEELANSGRTSSKDQKASNVHTENSDVTESMNTTPDKEPQEATYNESTAEKDQTTTVTHTELSAIIKCTKTTSNKVKNETGICVGQSTLSETLSGKDNRKSNACAELLTIIGSTKTTPGTVTKEARFRTDQSAKTNLLASPGVSEHFRTIHDGKGNNVQKQEMHGVDMLENDGNRTGSHSLSSGHVKINDLGVQNDHKEITELHLNIPFNVTDNFLYDDNASNGGDDSELKDAKETDCFLKENA